MKTKFEQIVNAHSIASHNSIENMTEIIALGKSEQFKPANEDTKQTLLLAIDIQNDFMEDIGSLGVSGSRKDVLNLTQWVYSNAKKLTQVICSLDTHAIAQIFHADWWRDQNGNTPAPFTIITSKDVEVGTWIPFYGEKEKSLTYLENIERSSKKQLCIWPYHCLAGTEGAKLESEFTKMLYFHASARSSCPILVQKGQDPYTEMYGIIKAEYDASKHINQQLLDTIAKYDAIYIAGEASSHCVLASTIQIIEYFSDRPDITSRITLLEDCMSPIAGYEEETKQQFEDLKKKYHINLKKSTEVVL